MPTCDELTWLQKNASLRMDAMLNGAFDPQRQAFHRARYEFASEHVGDYALNVADVACGTGYGSRIMMEAGASSVIGVDIDAEAVRYATANHGQSGARFVAAEAAHLPFADASFDMLVSFETLEHVPDDHAAIAEFCRVIRPGGCLICSVPNNWGLSKHHVRNYDRASLLDLVDPWFKGTQLYNQNSGSPRRFVNRGQPAGIVVSTEANFQQAECFILTGVKR